MRFGTSRTLSRRAKLRRVRGASTVAKTATPQGRRGRAEGALDEGSRVQARPAKIAHTFDAPCSRGATSSHGPRPDLSYVAKEPAMGGFDYRPVARSVAAISRSRHPDVGDARRAES